MKKNNNIKAKHVLVIIIILMLIFGVGVYTVTKRNDAISTEQQTRTYKSKDLKFTINIPSKFQLEERFTTILLKYSNKLIQITRSGTNYNTLDAHLDNLSKFNDLTFLTKENLIINGYPAVKGVIQEEIHYFIYADNWVYSISTSSEDLFDDLDQIASSFRYAP